MISLQDSCSSENIFHSFHILFILSFSCNISTIFCHKTSLLFVSTKYHVFPSSTTDTSSHTFVARTAFEKL